MCTDHFDDQIVAVGSDFDIIFSDVCGEHECVIARIDLDPVFCEVIIDDNFEISTVIDIDIISRLTTHHCARFGEECILYIYIDKQRCDIRIAHNRTVREAQFLDTAVSVKPVLQGDSVAKFGEVFALLFDGDDQVVAILLEDQIIMSDPLSKLQGVLPAYINDQIFAITFVEEIGIITQSTFEYIGTCITGECVIPFSGFNCIITLTGSDDIVPITTVDDIITASGIDRVGTCISLYRIIAGSAADSVIPFSCDNPVITLQEIDLYTLIAEDEIVIPTCAFLDICQVNLGTVIQKDIFDSRIGMQPSLNGYLIT